ncbi:MAG: sulfatase-like hydrolase/transferase [Verrucomicrobia bacterium]|nr:sulfatase-like hydrolase/transferase [Verrucomicrobiota bacterium]MCH8513088.1 sulfatase-like hydrolase/transferase [Kiritimatiellia bacterium]
MRPNFLIIQCDDLGWDDLGLHGNPWVKTPHLDRLGRESVRCDDFSVNPVCAPSRATFLTGRHFLRTGVSHVHGGKDFLHPDERTLAEHFQAAGYQTGMWGKWHLGHTEGYLPWQRGFGEAYLGELYAHREARGRLNGQSVQSEKWSDERLADYAIDFIRRHRDRPFFAYLPTLTPHTPCDAPETLVSDYRNLGLSTGLATVYAMVSFLDTQIGRVLAALDEEGLADRTVVVFMSDHGPAINERELDDHDRKLRKVHERRGWKGDLYENGVRSPFFIRFPAILTPKVIQTPLSLEGLAPTLLGLAGISPVPDTPPMDGKSFVATLKGEPGPEGIIYNHAHRGWLTSGPPYSLAGIPGEYDPLSKTDAETNAFETQTLSVRKGDFKLLLNPDFASKSECRLIHLAQDPGETRDVGEAFPGIRDELYGKARSWWTSICRESHAFSPPVLRGMETKCMMPGNLPCALHGHARNSVNAIRNCRHPGDGARYRLRFDEPCRMSISIAPEDATVTWRCRVSETESEATCTSQQPAVLSFPAGDAHLDVVLESVEPCMEARIQKLWFS